MYQSKNGVYVRKCKVTTTGKWNCDRVCTCVPNAHGQNASHDWSILLLHGPLVTGVDSTAAEGERGNGRRTTERKVRRGNKACNQNVNYIKMSRRSDQSESPGDGLERRSKLSNPANNRINVADRRTGTADSPYSFFRRIYWMPAECRPPRVEG